MRYPRIYSLSTVGVLKHYNQDYLVHPIRTDFTGNNGVGKSIIADLIQLIFIPDRKHVVFGTEGLKKEERQIHSLPHSSCSEAYAFLNVEVDVDQFIVIGVCIPNNQSRQLKPFYILADVDNQKETRDIAIPKEKLVTHNHFVISDKIPTLEELAKHLRDRHKLYLKHFTYKEERNDYYSFLFNRNILPMNLTIDDNLVALAKIIQSFSRARSLDVNDSESLKKFLFEDTEKLYEKVFQSHKADLAKLMTDYRDTDDYIKDLTEKQLRLTALKTKENQKAQSHKDLLLKEVKYLWSESKIAEQQRNKAQSLLQGHIERVHAIKERLPKLSRITKRVQGTLDKATKHYEALLESKSECQKYASLKLELKELTSLVVPALPEVQKSEINIADYTVEAIVRKAKSFLPVYSDYGSLIDMNRHCEKQQEMIARRKISLSQEIDSLNEIIELIEKRRPETILAKAIEDGKELSLEQEIVLFSLLDVVWNKPTKGSNAQKYTTSLDILNSSNIQSDIERNGFWFKTGYLSTFYKKDNRKQLLGKGKILEKAAASRVEQIKAEIAVKQSEINELGRFIKGDTFDKDKILIGVNLDSRIKDFTLYAELESTARLLTNLDQKAIELQSQLEAIGNKLRSKGIELNISEELMDTKVEQLRSLVKTLTDRKGKFDNLKIGEEQEESSLSTSTIPLLMQSVEEKARAFNEAQFNYIEKETYAKREIEEFSVDLTSHEVVDKKSIMEASSLYDRHEKDYVTEYKSLANYFLTSKGISSPEIEEQNQKGAYRFNILETILLGSKIKHIDNISNELREANGSRLRMADTIHETMLKIFSQTKAKYDRYKTIIRKLNTFFKGKKISNRHYFQIKFIPQTEFNIEWIAKLQSSSQQTYKKGELPFGDTVEHFIEEFFKSVTNYKKRIHLSDLLDPKTYFDLTVSLTDENNKETTGSTGETYSAIVLLGIGRLSIVQDENRAGIRFIILEETANLDKVNFNTFPNLAEEFGYQIITMTPKPYGSDSDKGWYLHHLLPSEDNSDINYPEIASYFKTNENKVDLEIYLEALKNELEHSQGVK
jgi:DNA repair protein SbcC/Rad50